MFFRLRLPGFLVTGASALAASSYINHSDPEPIYSVWGRRTQGAEPCRGGGRVCFSGRLHDGVFLHRGRLTTFAPDNYSSAANVVNNSGQIAGFGRLFPTAFIFNRGGSYIQLRTLGGLSSEAFGINNLGDSVGMSATPAFLNHAFLYTGGPLTDLGTFGGSTSTALSINDSGQVAGFAQTANGANHAFLYSNGALKDLGTLGGPASQASSINMHGAVVGAADVAGGAASHAFLYTDGAMKDLGTLGGTSSYASSINAGGDIVGNSDLARSAIETHAFLYHAGAMTDLNSQIDPASGWVLETAGVINDAGQITGMGTLKGVFGAYLITPSAPALSIEIKPGSKPPVRIRPGGHGLLRVAILGSADFAVSGVDIPTIRFGPGGARNVPAPEYRDINRDGFPDLIVHFRTDAAEFQCGNTMAQLSLRTFAGRELAGEESIVTAGCKGHAGKNGNH